MTLSDPVAPPAGTAERRPVDGVIPELIGCTDVQVWAREFVRMAHEKPGMPVDEGAMICWFANAMMAKADAIAQAPKPCRHKRWVLPEDPRGRRYGRVSGVPPAVLRVMGARCAKCGVMA